MTSGVALKGLIAGASPMAGAFRGASFTQLFGVNLFWKSHVRSFHEGFSGICKG
jgi:hypothetical protein